jgi:hypothetical protein
MLNIEQQKAVHGVHGVHGYIYNLIDSPGASSSELEALKIRTLKTQITKAIIEERIVEERIKKVDDELKKHPLDKAALNNLLLLFDKLTKQKNEIHSAGAELIKVCQQLEKDTKRKEEIYSAMTDALLEGNEDLRNELENKHTSAEELVQEAMMY